MKKTSSELDALKEIILLYANIEPTPIENLRILKEELLAPRFLCFSDLPDYGYIWIGMLGLSDLYDGIETTIRIHDMGLEKAKDLLDDLEGKDKFLCDVTGYAVFPSEVEKRRELYDSAFHEVYGYSASRGCPCSWGKMKALAEKGFVTANEDSRKSTWINERLNCLECNHLHFVTILEGLAKGNYDHLSESEIVAKYCQTTIEEVEFSSGKHLLRKVSYCSYEENEAAWPKFLNGMPCNILIDFLSSEPNAHNIIKRCPICRDFFFARKADRILSCYEPECEKKLQTHIKCYQREKDPVKYGSSKPKEGDIDEYNRLKAIWDNNIK